MIHNVKYPLKILLYKNSLGLFSLRSRDFFFQRKIFLKRLKFSLRSSKVSRKKFSVKTKMPAARASRPTSTGGLPLNSYLIFLVSFLCGCRVVYLVSCYLHSIYPWPRYKIYPSEPSQVYVAWYLLKLDILNVNIASCKCFFFLYASKPLSTSSYISIFNVCQYYIC